MRESIRQQHRQEPLSSVVQRKQKQPGRAVAPRSSFDFSGLAIFSEQQSGGIVLPGSVRRQAEQSLGADFSSVRVHQDGLADANSALAVACGDDLHFAPGEYQPQSRSGLQLLGHELQHVVQQRRGQVPRPAAGMTSGASVVEEPALEADAERAGDRLSHGERGSPEAIPAQVSQTGPTAMQLRRRNHKSRPPQTTETEQPAPVNGTVSPAAASAKATAIDHLQALAHVIEIKHNILELKNISKRLGELTAGWQSQLDKDYDGVGTESISKLLTWKQELDEIQYDTIDDPDIYKAKQTRYNDEFLAAIGPYLWEKYIDIMAPLEQAVSQARKSFGGRLDFNDAQVLKFNTNGDAAKRLIQRVNSIMAPARNELSRFLKPH